MPKTGNNLTLSRCDVRAAGAVQRAADLGRSHGGVMRKNEHLIISAIIALSAGGSIAASGAISATVSPAPTVQVVTGASCASPPVYLV